MDLQNFQNAPRKNLLKVVVAVGIAVLSVLMMLNYIKKEQDKAEQLKLEYKRRLEEASQKKQMVSVLVASRDIPEQTPITSEDLAQKEFPAEYIQPEAVSSIGQAIGLISASKIVAGEQILKSKLLAPGSVRKNISELTPSGKRAVPVSVDNMSNLAGLLQPGDYVDVLVIIAPPSDTALYAASLYNPQDQVKSADSKKSESEKKYITLPLFQNVLVLAVGAESSPSLPSSKKEKAPAVSGVTLALSAQEAALIAFVQEQGKIRLVMRSNSDFESEAVKPANWDTLFQYLYPDAKEIKRPDMVEIYRGLKKEVVPIITTEERK